ncbi:tyrosine-protein phosphatase [Rhodococcus sp. BE178]|uniref:tyrosine-protein phosphatase n=1 Tax=Rhodococcus sp. BE178 TaxID=2817737 RepID=UPI003D1F3D9E
MTTNLDRTPSRRLPARGVHNLRDVGGYPTVSNLTTKWGKLFRSDALHGIDADGRAELAGRGLALVIDLRETDERTSAPNALDGVGHREVHLPVYRDGLGTRGATYTAETLDLGGIYTWMLDDHGSALTDAVRLIADSGSDPVLVHCTAGKDRTGLVIALALAAVGVDDRDIAADYSLSELMLAGEWVDAMTAVMAARGLPAGTDITQIVASSPAPLMLATLASLRERHGDVPDYLRAHGMTDIELDNLRVCLLG